MRLVACLSFYDEPAEPIYDATASLAAVGIARLIALDGAYADYPDATGTSPADNHQALQQAAQDTGITLDLHVPSAPWVSELEKRTQLFALAHHIAEPGIDWLVSTDGDDHWDHDPTYPTLDQALAHLPEPAQAASVQYAEVNASGQDQWQPPFRRCYRAQPTGITVNQHHARYIAGDGTVLWDASRPGINCPTNIIPGISIRHKPWLRSRQRLEHREAYYRARSDLKLETI
jgi:hypothetical protein